jgi:hypothetical protein
MKRRRWIVLVSTAAIVAACGSRTGLLVPTEQDAGPADVSVPRDARADVGVDVVEEPDAPEEDALPPIDVVVPPGPNPCPDAGSTLVYVITSDNVLLSFYPPTATFTTIGTIACPTSTAGDSPFSMAVDHAGIAYVAFASGDIFRVSTANAACVPTKRVPTAGPFVSQYGMGFAANVGADGGPTNDGGDAGDNVETLYLAGNPGGLTPGNLPPVELGSMSTTTFTTTSIGIVTPSIFGSELTGTGSGQLFGFYVTDSSGTAAAIGELDRTTGQLVAMNNLPGVNIAGGWAFAFWGGDFYTFTAPDTDTIVQRFRPSDGSVTMVTTLPHTVVGAGVSTCAPQQ